MAMSLTGCATTSFFSIEGVTHQKLVEIVCSVVDEKTNPDEVEKCKADGAMMPEEVKILRSKFIAGTLGNYGARGVEKFSNERAEGDAMLILAQLRKINVELNNKMATIGQPRNVHYEYVKYLEERVSKLVDAAIQPKKRYYESKVLGFIGAGFNVEAAKTAGEAILELLKIKEYKNAILKDMYDSLKDNKADPGDWVKADNLLQHACSRLAARAGLDDATTNNPCPNS